MRRPGGLGGAQDPPEDAPLVGYLTIAASGAWNAHCACGQSRNGHLIRGQRPPAWPWHDCPHDDYGDDDPGAELEPLWRRRGGR